MSNKTPLLDEVLKYKKEENLIFSMPGNKCGKVFLKDNIGKEFVDTMGYLDITEVDFSSLCERFEEIEKENTTIGGNILCT